MKKYFKFFVLALFMLASFSCLNFTQKVYADDTASEMPYADVWVNDLSGFATSGATIDTKTNNITNLPAYGRFGFDGDYENIQVKSIVNFSKTINGGNTVFYLRTQGDVVNASYTRKGYYVRWYNNGQFEFYKNDTSVLGVIWGPIPAISNNVDYNVVFKTVNMSDGSVKILFTINDLVVIDHIDTTDPILGGGLYAMSTDGNSLSVVGKGLNTPIVNLNDVADPIVSSNFPNAVIQDGIITTSDGEDCPLGYSGVGYSFLASNSYGYKAKVTPSSASGRLVFSIGAYKTNSHEMNRPNISSSGVDGWGWDETGYVLYWSANGQRHFARGDDNTNLLEYLWNMPSFVAGQEYEIEYSMTTFGDGSVRILFKLDGVIMLNYLDRAREGYTPVQIPSAGAVAPANLYTNALICSISVSTKIAPVDSTVVDTKTVIYQDMNNATTLNDSVFDRNGAVDNFNSGVAVGYNANISNSAIKFNTEFSSIGTGITYLLNYQGSLDQTWGGGWTKLGYAIKLYPNGMVGLIKGGNLVCEGWALSNFSLVQETNYLIEIATINLGDAVHIYAKINDVYVLNYLDTKDTITSAGWFAVYSEGFSGNIKPFGVEYPTITADFQGETLDINSPVQLSYNLSNKQDSDVVEYFIDQEASTATATLQDNVLTATSEGDIVVYAKVNEIYSEDLIINVSKSAYAIVTNLPTQPIIVGGEKITIDGKMSDDSEITSKEFSVENITGSATIDSNGTITAISAGTVKVYVTINGLKSQGDLIYISPKVSIKNASALAVGATIDSLGYQANCELPQENIITVYELVSGQDVVSLDSQTGKVTALKIGTFSVRVIVTGETFQAVSPIVELSVEAPIVVLRNVKDMFVGQTLTLNAQINEGITIESKEIVIVSGDGIQIDGENITAIKQGTVTIKAVINGYSSDTYKIVILPVIVTIVASDMPIGSTQELNIMFNDYPDNRIEYTKVEYSISSGAKYATLTGNALTSLDKSGQVTLKVVVDDKYTNTITINITPKVIIKGITDGLRIKSGSKIPLEYYVYPGGIEGEITSVEYVIVSGKNHAIIKDNTLIAKTAGSVELKVVVNGVSSQILTINIYVNPSKLVGFIVLGAVLLLILIVVIYIVVSYIIKVVKAKKRNENQKTISNSQQNNTNNDSSYKVKTNKKSTQHQPNKNKSRQDVKSKKTTLNKDKENEKNN